MRRDRPAPVAYEFKLPPFTVQCTPAPDPNNYIRYEMYLDGVLVRTQISYPELADGWYGVGETLRRENKTIIEEQLHSLREHQGQQLTHTNKTLLSHGAISVKVTPLTTIPIKLRPRIKTRGRYGHQPH